MPELDARHRDASAWALNATPEEQSWSENAELQKNAYQQYSDPSASPSQVSPYSFQDNRLNSAPPEPRNSSTIQSWFAEDSDSDDDYCSTIQSNLSENANDGIVAAWAVFHRRKTFAKRKFGKTPRQGTKRPHKAWVIDNKRNLSNEVPRGWSKDKWLARTPCVGCGSRWHRSCEGLGAKAHFIKKQKGHKGQKGGQSSSSFNPGKGNFGKSHFAFLMMSGLLQAASSMFVPALSNCPVFESIDSNCSNVFDFQMFEKAPNDNTFCSCFQHESFSNASQHNSAINELFVVNHCFPAHQLQEYLMRDDSMIVRGIEPLHEQWRSERHEYLLTQPDAKLRYAILCDTGAPDNAAGRNWLGAFQEAHNVAVVKVPYKSKLSGIGSGSAEIKEKWRIVTGLTDIEGDCYEGLWEAQCLEGIGSTVPPLWGLSSQIALRTIFDFSNPANLRCSCQMSTSADSRRTFDLMKHHGHILLPVDWGGHPIPSKDKFVYDPLGLDVWLTNEPEQTSVENADPAPTVMK
jgi:hypothetical protein